MSRKARLIEGNNYKPLDDDDSMSYYDLYNHFVGCMLATESDLLYKEYKRQKDKYVARLKVAYGELSQEKYDTMTF